MAGNEKKKEGPRELASNRKARHLYHVVEKVEAGIELRGSEVKSLRDGGGSIAESWIVPLGTELFVRGMTVTPYAKASAWTEPSTRDRKLLMHRREIDRFAGQATQRGMTIIPLRVYVNERGKIKMEVALCKGKDAHDRRDDLKERDVRRELAREYKIR